MQPERESEYIKEEKRKSDDEKKKKTPKAEMRKKNKFLSWRFGIFVLYEKRAKLLEEEQDFLEKRKKKTVFPFVVI